MNQAKDIAQPWINGEWRSTAAHFESTNPANGQLVSVLGDADNTLAQVAIDAAQSAFRNSIWSKDRGLRIRVLLELADRLDALKPMLIEQLSTENGKLSFEATGEVNAAISKVRYTAALANVHAGRAAEVAPGLSATQSWEAAGVAGIIVPWNAPVILMIRSLAPALAAGCTAVIKVAPQTAATSHLVAKCLSEIEGLPAGVVNIFSETGSAGAQLLTESPGVNVISYTGSTSVGRAIMKAAAPTLKRLNLELGGKSPCIVCRDADLDRTVPGLVFAGTLFAGQFCMAGSRILVHSARAEELQDRLTKALRAIRVGPASDPHSQMGPLIDLENRERVRALVAESGDDGEVLVQGEPISKKGAFLGPSLVAPRRVDASIVQEEIFGPVMTFETYDSAENAVELANATEFGLAASIWSSDHDRIEALTRSLNAGTVWVNGHGFIADQFEEGGFKQSGIGRLNGLAGLETFLEAKTIYRFPPKE